MRVFFALEFNKELKRFLKEQQQFIINNSLKGNFTSEGNFHLTLKFIGDIDNNKLQSLRQVLEKVAGNNGRIELVLKNLGYFPRGNKKIIWIGIEDNTELNKLFKNLDQKLALLGYERENRKYTPHITLGREVVLHEDFNILKDRVELKEKIEIKSVSLMESTRLDGKLVYRPVYSESLLLE